MHLKPGTILHDSYRIIRFINSGGFGCTYEAVHVEFGERVAIKEFYWDMCCVRDDATGVVSVPSASNVDQVEKLKERFRQEAIAIRKLNHDHIINVADVFKQNGTVYYVMDYIEGESLKQIVDRRGPLPEAEALNYIRQIASALEYIHSKGVLHLDIKPANIMVDASGRAVLIDFGASKMFDNNTGGLTQTMFGHTNGYASPEQVNADVRLLKSPADIYSLGATLYFLLTGKVPSNVVERQYKQLQPLPASVSAATQAAVNASLSLAIEKRPQSATAFLSILDGKVSAPVATPAKAPAAAAVPASSEATVIDQTPIPPKKTPAVSETKSDSQSDDYFPDYIDEPKRSKLPWIICILLLLAIAAGVYYFLNQPSNEYYNEYSDEYAGASNYRTLSDGSRVYNVNGVDFTMKPVDGGTFQMGSIDGWDRERPVHSVTLSSYYIGETEVTQELWEAVMGSNPSEYKGSRRPIETVSYNDCKTFISRLNSMTGQNFRLPTEAEWEFAARGGNSSRGYKYSGSDNIGSVAWYGGNSGTHEVKGKNPNELGLYDMSGNVWEWCNDWYDDYPSGSVTNPRGPGSGSNRVIRGGSWSFIADYCRSAIRYCNDPDFSLNSLGLRLAQ